MAVDIKLFCGANLLWQTLPSQARIPSLIFGNKVWAYPSLGTRYGPTHLWEQGMGLPSGLYCNSFMIVIYGLNDRMTLDTRH